MAILKVARMGHPILRRLAQPVKATEINTPEFQSFIKDMIETMREYDGIGLAAPQVHRSQRISVVEIPEDPKKRSKTAAGVHVFINPEVEVLTEERNGYWEGCLSVPGLRGFVLRPNKIKVSYLDEKALRKEVHADGFLATVLQHEFDHLDGKIYVDRIEDMTKLVFEQEFEKHLMTSSDEIAD